MTSPSLNRKCRFYEGRWSPGGVLGVDRLFHFCLHKSEYIPDCVGCRLDGKVVNELARHWV